MKGLKKYMTELEEMIVTELAKRGMDIEISKIVYLKLRNDQHGQNMLIQYLRDTQKITEENLLLKVREISKN
ncbi:MAG: hypothetical protein IKP28_06210 [Clostridia bacterium]|nr:hypothetical protein [Clostridia bacterium]